MLSKNIFRIIFISLCCTSVFAGCATERALVKAVTEKGRLTPTERLMVSKGEGNAAMEVVTNDNEAGDKFLRTESKKVDPKDPDMKLLVDRMQATLNLEKGVGIAAPQVGINKRVIIVQRLDSEKEDKPFAVYLNPVITEHSTETVIEWEGCLSIPAGFGKVKRYTSVKVDYDNLDGSHGLEKIEGFTARIFQHEIDHLNGILFIDRKEKGDLMPEKEYREMRKREKEAKEKAGSAEEKPAAKPNESASD